MRVFETPSLIQDFISNQEKKDSYFLTFCIDKRKKKWLYSINTFIYRETRVTKSSGEGGGNQRITQVKGLRLFLPDLLEEIGEIGKNFNQ